MRIVPLLAGLALGSFAAFAPANGAPDEKVLCVHGVGAAGTLDLRAGPGPRHAVTAQLAVGTCGLKIIGQCTGGWCEMEVGGRKGWADTRFVSVNERDPVAATVIRPTEPAKPAEVPPRAADVPAAPAAAPVAAAPPPAVTARNAAPTKAARQPVSEARSLRPVKRAVPRVERQPEPREARVQSRPWFRAGIHWERLLPRFVGWRCRPAQGCVVNVDSWDTLRLRSGPGVEHRQLSEIPSRACGVERRGACVGHWCQVRFRHFAGWVNTRYLN